jgi:hypothetical protein
MIQTSEGDREDMKEAKLPGRDWILLPAISLMTICGILASAECIARRMFTSTGNLGRYCMIGDNSTGYRGIPNSVCTDKNPETPLIEYRFNKCGHRTEMECGPKPPGTYRIVLVGSSVAMGWTVPEEKAFAALLPADLSLRTGRRVEVYDEAYVGEGGTPHNIAVRFNDVQAAEPDMILWIMTPFDIENTGFKKSAPPMLPEKAGKTGFLARVRNRIQEALAKGSIADEILALWKSHSISSMTEHFLYESQSLYVKSSLVGPKAEFLRAEPSQEWKEDLQRFDSVAADVEGRAKAAGVPLIAVFLPNRAHAAIISVGEWPAGYNPYKLDDELRSIVTSHGGTYIDILPDFQSIPNPEQHYYPVDGHPDAEGHLIISGLLARALTSGAVPALKAVVQPQAAKEQGR